MQQDVGGLKVPGVGQQLWKKLFSEQAAGKGTQRQQRQCAGTAGGKSGPALQQKIADGKAQAVDDKDHGKTSFRCDDFKTDPV